MKTLKFPTSHKTQLMDISSEVKEAVITSGIKEGFVSFSLPIRQEVSFYLKMQTKISVGIFFPPSQKSFRAMLPMRTSEAMRRLISNHLVWGLRSLFPFMTAARCSENGRVFSSVNLTARVKSVK